MKSEEEIKLASGLPDWEWHELRRRYSWPKIKRHYHTFKHALDVANTVLYTKGQWKNSRAALLAALYHDVVYQAGSQTNELQSAEFLFTRLKGYEIPCSTIYRAQTLVMVTAFHFSIERERLDHDEALFLDCDLAGFAKPYKEFVDLQKKVDQEFLPLAGDEENLKHHRLKFFNMVLSNKSIYLTDYMRNQLEARARCNIKKYINEVYGSEL